MLTQIYENYLHIKKQCDQLITTAKQIAQSNYSKTLEILQTNPEISDLSSIVILVEIGGDISKFATAEQLCSWSGLRPKNDESAGKIKSRKITKGNKYLRRILVQNACEASRKKLIPSTKVQSTFHPQRIKESIDSHS